MSAEPKKPKLLEQVKISMRTRRYAPRIIKAYQQWMRRYTLYHHKRHPKDMGLAEVDWPVYPFPGSY